MIKKQIHIKPEIIVRDKIKFKDSHFDFILGKTIYKFKLTNEIVQCVNKSNIATNLLCNDIPNKVYINLLKKLNKRHIVKEMELFDKVFPNLINSKISRRSDFIYELEDISEILKNYNYSLINLKTSDKIKKRIELLSVLDIYFKQLHSSNISNLIYLHSHKTILYFLKRVTKTSNNFNSNNLIKFLSKNNSNIIYLYQLRASYKGTNKMKIVGLARKILEKEWYKEFDNNKKELLYKYEGPYIDDFDFWKRLPDLNHLSKLSSTLLDIYKK